MRKRFLDAAISATKAIAKSVTVGPLSGTISIPNINGMDEIDNMRERSIFDFMEF